MTAARLDDIFSGTRAVSSDYGIVLDGTVDLYVEKKNRSWCSSIDANDQRAITIEWCLNKTAGEKTNIDSHFGMPTKAAVLSFRRKHHLASLKKAL